MNLEGKIAVVTGGAMGNGLGIVKSFLEKGAKVIILDYNEILEETLKELESTYQNASIYGYIVDIRDKSKLDSIANDVKQKFGNIDILVNNAGVCILTDFLETTDEIRDKQFDINIKGTWNVTSSFLPILNNGGSIVNLSSVTGVKVADKKEVAYATTKAAIMGFTKALAMELVDRNIRVNAILPGYVKTKMVEDMAKTTNEENPNQVIEDIEKNIPMKRMGTIEELGRLCLFLASDDASYITGTEIIFDGGSTLPETNTMGF